MLPRLCFSTRKKEIEWENAKVTNFHLLINLWVSVMCICSHLKKMCLGVSWPFKGVHIFTSQPHMQTGTIWSFLLKRMCIRFNQCIMSIRFKDFPCSTFMYFCVVKSQPCEQYTRSWCNEQGWHLNLCVCVCVGWIRMEAVVEFTSGVLWYVSLSPSLLLSSSLCHVDGTCIVYV